MYDLFKPENPVGIMDFVRSAKACITEITPDELLIKINSDEKLLIVDVREPSEFEHGHIADSHIVPRGIIEAAADPAYAKHYPPLSGARDQQVVLYCATSGRSAMAVAVLQMMGFKNVLNMSGGFTQWESQGLPIVRDAEF